MKVIKGPGITKVTVVCCLHGDEVFGNKIFHHYCKRIHDFPRLKIVLANTAALKAKKRYIDEDLNRCFPGNVLGNYEQRLAHKLLKEVLNTEFLLDIHTTTTDINIVPIVANLSPGTKRILNQTTSPFIVYMERCIAKHSLIAFTHSAVSMEIGLKYSKNPKSMEEITLIINGLLNDLQTEVTPRSVLRVAEVIPNDTPLPVGTRNLELARDIGIYPFLVGEKSYSEFQGFAAKYDRKILV